MNRKALAKALAERCGIARVDVAESYIKATFDIMAKELQKGDRVHILGFGRFFVKLRKGRKCVNPQNPGEKMDIPNMRVVKYLSARKLKHSIRLWPGNF